MLLHGRLWMPQHPLADFFDSFHLITRPVYASKYFPGTAMVYAPGLALHLPYWLMPALAAGAVVGLVYRVIGELLDGASGIVAAIPLLSVQIIYSLGVTGRWSTTPWAMYARQDDPYDGLRFGRFVPGLRPQSALPQKRDFSESFTEAAARERRSGNGLWRWMK